MKYDWKKTIIKYPKRKHLTLEELDKIPYYDENNNIIDNIHNERIEQYLANDFVNPNNVVLELGARYGTVSCVINNKLENPRNHIVFEPDNSVIDALMKNRKSHKSKFTIFNGIISNSKMKFIKDSYASTMEETINDDEAVKSWSLKEIYKITKLNFDCLIADCEGCLEKFFDENEIYIKNFKLIIFEADQPQKCNYKKIKHKLLSWNFTCILNGFCSVYVK